VKTSLLFLAVALTLVFSPKPQAQTNGSSLKKISESDLPGPPGKRFDYLTIDSDDHDLISAHLAAGQTYVIDLRTNKVVATVAGHVIVRQRPGTAKGVIFLTLEEETGNSNESGFNFRIARYSSSCFDRLDAPGFASRTY